MPFQINLYKNAECTESAKSVILGQAGITGHYANQGVWSANNWWDNNTIVYTTALFDTSGRNGVILSGATPIFNMLTQGDREAILDPTNHAVVKDRGRPNSSLVYNHFFIGKLDQTSTQLRAATLYFSAYQSSTWISFLITLNAYMQQPPTGRTNWDYDLVSGVSISSEMLDIGLYKSVSLYKINIWNKNWYLLACGVSAGGDVSEKTRLMLIPESIFNDKPIHPYVGPVSKDSAQSSFIPERGLIHDSIASRNLEGKKNPYGFNSGALKLCKLTNTAYGLLCAQIYNGSSGSILNQISQDVAALTGGNEHRNHEEVQAIQAGIMKIHLIPDITTIPTGAPYNISTIAGYKISGLVPVSAVPISDSMLVYSTPSVRILRTWKSYIDYEPYTTITLRIPYVGNINIPPSIIYDNAVSLTYHLDLFSGTLSVDIIIHDYANGNSYIFSTLQANCAVSLPIAGTAAAGAPLLKIASGLLGVAMSGVGTSANNIFSVISGLQDTKKSVPFGNFAQSNISAYFDSRHCYAIIQSVNPSNADTFLSDKGYVAHLSGIVNDFAGSGTEMHCRFESVDLTGLSKLTEQEKQEVESMLKAGVHIRKV